MKISNGRSYQSRAWFLKKLGYGSYADYLKSETWKQIREQVFEVKGDKCYLCGKPATQVHHTRYHEYDLCGEMKHLHPICGACHEGIEFAEDGTKLTLSQAKSNFKRLRKLKARADERKAIRDHLVLLLGFRGRESTQFDAEFCD